MPDLLQTIAGLCFQMEKAQSFDAVRDLLRSAATSFGASFYLFGIRTGRNISPPQQKVITNYPEPWQRYYDEHGAYAFDPVINKAFQFVGTFRWDGLHHDERQLALRRESVRNGMDFGFSCSDRGPEHSFGILSFCGQQRIAPTLEDWDATASAAALLAATTNKAVSRIIEARNERKAEHGEQLSDTERKCLEMMACAMTAEQAAAALKVRPRTVYYYLDRAAEKLGVTTRREAVMKALAEGIIDLRQFPKAGFGHDKKVRG
jgi:DNA-binding CsgD family transcriptional regulator